MSIQDSECSSEYENVCCEAPCDQNLFMRNEGDYSYAAPPESSDEIEQTYDVPRASVSAEPSKLHPRDLSPTIGKNFTKLRDHCLHNKTLFEDDQFPCNKSTLGVESTHPVEWKRPKEISANPTLFENRSSKHYVDIGFLGNESLWASVSAMALHKQLMDQVVPEDQGFDKDYTGIFHFKFWQNGKQVDVVIDDRLPTVYGKLVFLKSSSPDEFWCALLEKAYAKHVFYTKLLGSYGAIADYDDCAIKKDLTGGIDEYYMWPDDACPKTNVFQIILKAHKQGALITCSEQPDENRDKSYGLAGNHVTKSTKKDQHKCIITSVELLASGSGKSKEERPNVIIRCPSNRNEQWKRKVGNIDRDAVDIPLMDGAQFCMDHGNFYEQIGAVSICHWTSSSTRQGGVRRKGKIHIFEGEWVAGVTAGGSHHTSDTYCSNPQYQITLEDPDSDEENECTIVVNLKKKQRKEITQRKREMKGETVVTIFKLKEREASTGRLGKDFFSKKASVAILTCSGGKQGVCGRVQLPPGQYCLVPSAESPSVEGRFILEVFSEHEIDMNEIDHPIQIKGKAYPKIESVCMEPPQASSQSSETDSSDNDVDDGDDDECDDESLHELFDRKTGDDSVLDWQELKELLEEYMPEKFSKEVCRSLVATYDTDYNGNLDYEEFKRLMTAIKRFRGSFKKFDTSRLGYLTAYQLRDVFISAGYTLNNNILIPLLHRYGTRNGKIAFDDFVMCAVRLQTMLGAFKAKNPEKKKVAKIPLEEWMKITLYS